MPTIPDADLAWQMHCPECGAEHGMPVALLSSHGWRKCAHCGMVAPRLTVDEYRMLLRVQQEGE